LAATADHELVLNLTDGQYRALTRDLARLRQETGAHSNAAAIVDAVSRQVEATIEPSSNGKAAAAC
jgi:hypothetical protein